MAPAPAGLWRWEFEPVTDLRDRSLRVDEPEDADGARIWAVFGDLALALLLVMALFILAQFLHYEKFAVFEEIDRRRGEVAALITEAAARTSEGTGIVWDEELTIHAEGFAQQRIRFPEPMLFAPCGTTPQPDGQALILEVGEELARVGGYFESVQIEGHADSIPPTGACHEAVEDNWGLSSMRATSFLRLLVQEGVFPRADIVSAVGRGATQPISAPGASVEELGQDRRVELVLVYSEADAAGSLRTEPPDTLPSLSAAGTKR